MGDFNLDAFVAEHDLQDKIRLVYHHGGVDFVGTHRQCNTYVNNLCEGKYKDQMKVMTIWEFGSMKHDQGEYDGANAPDDPWDV